MIDYSLKLLIQKSVTSVESSISFMANRGCAFFVCAGNDPTDLRITSKSEYDSRDFNVPNVP